MIIYVLAALIYFITIFIFANEKKQRKFYLWVLLFGSILGPLFDIANYFFGYYDYYNFSYLILGTVPPVILSLYGPCCVIILYFSQIIAKLLEIALLIGFKNLF